MARFSGTTHRFAGTPSEPIFTGEAGIEALEAERRSLETQQKSLSQELREALARASKAEHAAIEARYLERGNALRRALQELEARLVAVRGVPGRPGLTTDLVIVPQVEQILQDLRTVIQRMASRHAGPIFDISGFLLPPDAAFDTRILLEGRNYRWWADGSDPEAGDLAFMEQARLYLAFQNLGWSPIPVGAVDGREESLEILEQVTQGK
ncbi:MAG: hypothetical protein OZSIB_3423 [Candidatus Ozemobacter sibiricus]|jgi:hypothetical protein|uniref:Uncharacterized protein n=1 Tax=Candidatus Ozemobacter sibiricus TaxID=2268124 RepID=A0A367ZSC1_9BACT|nr:MAG: hypothetical protein OZSIB_3423 [Candidatus Ozemobacter sibiricus]